MPISIKDLLEKAETATKNFIKAEEGKFICKIAEIKLTESQAKKPMVQLVMEVTEGEKSGARFNHYLPMASDKAKDITVVTLIKFAMNGYNISRERLEEDADNIDDLINNCVGEIQKKIKKVEALFDVERKKEGDYYKNKIQLHVDTTTSTSTESNFFDDVENKI